MKTALEYYKIACEKGFKNIPLEVIEGISKNSGYAYWYAEELHFNNIPECIVNGISKHSDYSVWYANGLNFKNIPNTINLGIVKHIRYFSQLNKIFYPRFNILGQFSNFSGFKTFKITKTNIKSVVDNWEL